MGIYIKNSDLKAVSRLTAQVKDISAGVAKKYQWAGLHRLAYNENGLVLYTNDGQVYLEWKIPVDSGSLDPFDVIVQAQKFNDICSRSEDEAGLAELAFVDGEPFLKQEHEDNDLCLGKEPHHEYPDPEKVKGSFIEVQVFSVSAAILSRNMKFIIPFIDSSNANSVRQVMTWTTEGDMLAGGSTRGIVRITGLPCPPLSMSFKQKHAKSVLSFLSTLEGDVYVTLNGSRYIFTCPTYGHSISVPGESVVFPSSLLKVDENKVDVFKFDGKVMATKVFFLRALLPAELDRLKVVILGERENAKLHISTLSESRKSRCGLPIVRESVYEGPPPEWKFDINCRAFETILAQMNGVILDGTYFFSDSYFSVSDERANEEDSFRSVFVPVQDTDSLVAELKAEDSKETTDKKTKTTKVKAKS